MVVTVAPHKHNAPVENVTHLHENQDDQEYCGIPDEPRVWRFGICACANPGRCCLSMICPCITTAQLAKKTEALPPPVAFAAALVMLPVVICFLRGKAREARDIDGSDAFEGKFY